MPDWINALAALLAFLLSAAAFWRSLRTESQQEETRREVLRIEGEHKALEKQVLHAQLEDRRFSSENAERERRRRVSETARSLVEWLYSVPRSVFESYRVLDARVLDLDPHLINHLDYFSITNGSGHERELAERIVSALRDVTRMQSEFASGRLSDPAVQVPAAAAVRSKLQDSLNLLSNMWSDCQLGERMEPFRVGLH